MHPMILRRVQQEPALLEAHSDVHVEEVVEKGDCAVDRNDRMIWGLALKTRQTSSQIGKP